MPRPAPPRPAALKTTADLRSFLESIEDEYERIFEDVAAKTASREVQELRSELALAQSQRDRLEATVAVQAGELADLRQLLQAQARPVRDHGPPVDERLAENNRELLRIQRALSDAERRVARAEEAARTDKTSLERELHAVSAKLEATQAARQRELVLVRQVHDRLRSESNESQRLARELAECQRVIGDLQARLCERSDAEAALTQTRLELAHSKRDSLALRTKLDHVVSKVGELDQTFGAAILRV